MFCIKPLTILRRSVWYDRRRIYSCPPHDRGRKTTITQAVGQLFILAQGGLFVPAEHFRYVLCDSIYTHFPADEDKTI